MTPHSGTAKALPSDRMGRKLVIHDWERRRQADMAAAAERAAHKRLQLRDQVLAQALRVSQAMGEGPQARQQWHSDVRDTPEELLQELLQQLSRFEACWADFSGLAENEQVQPQVFFTTEGGQP
ncbi:hypothetical protein G7045_10295 [Acidovorax sp. HDW3]|uniref:hypothetical protein n=1 Tax=Acidovorax sp. HDW3 TaxID=2714923 RepID=UPI00140E2D22|nr:hypothetical protein [Acidovorax sp. HDW3]QIL44621.1 hypothetical protein G7045_10295 [Acidovorax sp. HDW3]